MILTLNIKNTENMGTPDMTRIEEIVTALISSGSLSGMYSGKTIIHFDSKGEFKGVELQYFPYRVRTEV